MAKKYQSILFWFDGLFTSPTASITLTALNPAITGNEQITLRQKIQEILNDLTIGKIDVPNYCQQAGDAAGVKMAPDRLVQAIINLSTLNQPFCDIYQQIDSGHDPKVIVDIPQAWFEQLTARWNVTQSFPKDRLIFTEKFDLKRIYPDIFYFIPQAAGRSMEECLTVDPQQMRAVAAHKLGLASATYTYPRRMKIDLAIQGIWKTADDVFHPGGGGRPNL